MMEWNDSLSCNHIGIDNQHKKLIEIINKVSAALVAEEYEFEKVVDIVTDLDSYIHEHFEFEENLMEKCDFPESNEHINEHNALRMKMDEMKIFDVKNHEEFFSDLLIYLIEWLTNHIMKIDKNLGIYIAVKDAEK
jgi:hemerythrin-like metal-binding protein